MLVVVKRILQEYCIFVAFIPTTSYNVVEVTDMDKYKSKQGKEIYQKDNHSTIGGHVGANIRHFRKKAGLTQAELADMLKHPDKRLTISRTALAGYEQGQAFPPYEKLERIAAALKVSPIDIVIAEGTSKGVREAESIKRIQTDLFDLFGYAIEQDHSATLLRALELDSDDGQGITVDIDDVTGFCDDIPFKIIGNGKEVHVKSKELDELMQQIKNYSQFLIDKLIDDHTQDK